MSLMNVLLCKTKEEVYSVDKENDRHTEVKESFSKLVSEKKAELFSKVLSGNTEQSFQTGAGSYTETEWKKLLREVDAAQSSLRNSNKPSETKTERTRETSTYSSEKSEDKEKGIEMLMAEFTTAIYSNDNGTQDDTYYTFYSQDGIYCKKQDQSGFEWEIKFTNSDQYKKVMDFLQDFDTQDNLIFASHENFWQEFLSGEINVNKFNGFMTAEFYKDNSVTIIPSGRRCLPDFVKDICYTTEEALMRFQPNVPEKDSTDHEVINLDRIDLYYAKHLGEIGKKNHFYNGKWYSFAELAMIWKKEFEELLSDDSIKKEVTFDNVYYNTK